MRFLLALFVCLFFVETADAAGCNVGAGPGVWVDPCPISTGTSQPQNNLYASPEVSVSGNSLPDGNEYFSLSWRCGSPAAQRRLAASLTARTLGGRLIDRYKGEFLIEAALYQPSLLSGFNTGVVFSGNPVYRAPMLHYIYDDTGTNAGSPTVTILDGGCQTDIIRNLRKSNTVRIVIRVLYTQNFSREPAFGNFLRASSAIAGLLWGGPIGGAVSANLMSAGQQASQESFANFLNKFADSADISAPIDFPVDKTTATVTFGQGVTVSVVKVGRESLVYDGSNRTPLPSSGLVGEFRARALVDVRTFAPSATEVANMSAEDARAKVCSVVSQKISDLNLSDKDRLMLAYAFAASPPSGPGKPCFQPIEVDYLASIGWKKEPYPGAFPKPDAPMQTAGR